MCIYYVMQMYYDLYVDYVVVQAHLIWFILRLMDPHAVTFVMMPEMEARVSQPVSGESVIIFIMWLSSTSLYSHQAALLYFTKCFRLAPHHGSHPSCSKPAGYFCSICLLPPTEQLTLQQLYDSGAFQNVRFMFGSSMLVWHMCGTKTLKLSPCSQ